MSRHPKPGSRRPALPPKLQQRVNRPFAPPPPPPRKRPPRQSGHR